MKTPRITFRKGETHSGMMRLPRTYTASFNGMKIATIQEAHRDLSGDAWFWYGDSVNTSGHYKTLEACKADIREHFKNQPFPIRA